jgi:hypothetical protein
MTRRTIHATKSATATPIRTQFIPLDIVPEALLSLSFVLRSRKCIQSVPSS